MEFTSKKNAIRLSPLLLTCLLLASCGGGGGGSSAAPGSSPGTSPSGVNNTPVVSNLPASSVTGGSSYSYTPSVTDLDGDTLAFSITNRPNWASFNSKTGKLSGTPTSDNAGTTQGVVITVSDGKSTTSVGPFSITVTGNYNGTATLKWVAPTTRQDGKPFSLSELKGYKIFAGTSAGNLIPVTTINNPTTTSYTFLNLASGKHYFTVTAFDIYGAESTFSNVGSKTIQ